MSDDHFTKAVTKHGEKQGKQSSEIARLKKEASRHLTMTEKDKKLKALADLDSEQGALAKGEELFKEEKRIVGKQPKGQTDREILGIQGKLTTEQKIQKELEFVTGALELNSGQAKHWFNKLKREYEEQEKREKVMAQLKARKEFRKMMKSFKLPEVLQKEEDYEKFYDAPGTVNDPEHYKKEDDTLPSHFENDKEAMFYKDDIDFLRFHKRTTNNVHEALQELINSAKQTVYSGIKQNFKVTLNYVTLNRSVSVVTAFWTLNRIDKIQLSQSMKFNAD